MAISIGEQSISATDILSVTSDLDILYYYFGDVKFYEAVNSPLREDRHPSFGFYISSSGRVRYKDYSTGEGGGIFDLLMSYWRVDYKTVLERVWKDLPKFSNADKDIIKLKRTNTIRRSHSNSIMECRVREWRDYDIAYWESYGITLPWLKWADVYPISHKIIIKDNKRMVFTADKYAYAYVERKEGRTTLKIYQPLVKDKRWKWANKHDKSVISLWTKIPEYGERVCICSSLKDALCLSCQTGIPAISIQGEGYSMSNTAISELKRRYSHIYILLDNDEAGILDGRKLSEATGFTNIVLPKFEGGKDISDYFKILNNPTLFRDRILTLFKEKD